MKEIIQPYSKLFVKVSRQFLDLAISLDGDSGNRVNQERLSINFKNIGNL